MKLSKLFLEFFNSEKAGGLILIVATAASLILANSALQNNYLQIWLFVIGGHSIVHWINDGLMTIFFLLIGLELEREIYIGELSTFRNALLPVFGAIGGMLVPAGLFLIINYGGPGKAGAGIPMATDIAFAIGILALLGNRVPPSLKIFLTALAIVDDMGAIIIIAIFYSSSVSITYLMLSFGIFFILLILNKLRVNNLVPYLLGGGIMWYFMLHSGIHATISGILLAFVIPFSKAGERSPSALVEHFLHKPVAFIILPLFALANTSILLNNTWHSGVWQNVSLGIITGLVFGKPVGIWLFTRIAVLLKVAGLPADLKWTHILGAGLLGGIGFTMSIFIALLAFNSDEIIQQSKIAILIASIIAGITGLIWLRFTLKPIPPPDKR